jgi:pimeloyl-ACP methyl ester carboxylesterase
MPDARLAVIPKARHAPELDQPELTQRFIQEFLA